MKKIYTTIMMMLLASVSLFTFTSCENSDEMVASYIDGYWEGNLTTNFYSFRGTQYIYTQIEFARTNTYGGDGYERDYYNRYSYNESYFRWTIENEYIIIRYDDGTEIYAYFNGPRHDVDGDLMTGVFRSSRSGRILAEFELHRINYWYRDWYDDGWYAKQMQLTGDSLTVKEEE
ncbi:MAG: hypothetical protein IJV13_07030 [Prevotella sp.]|nr:hypothetical protein [Prevotella sp.]MBQ9651945.1 hypothetical protein [Prevotella sp.]